MPCANVSRITAPPAALCTICGKRVRTIRMKRTYSFTPTLHVTYGYIPEIWTSATPLGHHFRRFFDVRGRLLK